MLYIKDIQPNSPAANCNRLRTGDQLLQVNDNCLVGVTHGEALNILKNTPPLVKLTVARKKNSESDGTELVAEGRRIADLEEPIVSSARESSTISKTSSELSLSPPTDRGQRPKSLVSLSSFGTPYHSGDHSPGSPNGSFHEPDEYIPAYFQQDSPTLNLRQDDVPVTIIDGIPGEDDESTEQEEDDVRPVNKSVSWAVSSDECKVFTVELLKNGRAGLGMSVSGGVDTPYDDVMVSQHLNLVQTHTFLTLPYLSLRFPSFSQSPPSCKPSFLFFFISFLFTAFSRSTFPSSVPFPPPLFYSLLRYPPPALPSRQPLFLSSVYPPNSL